MDNKIYLVGGNADGKASNRVFRLDLGFMNGSWEELPPMPGDPRTQPVCAAVNSRLYVFGGFAGPQGDKAATMSLSGLCYHPTANTWVEVRTPCDENGESISLGGGAAVVMGDRIICTGGVNKEIFLNALNGQYERQFYLSQDPSWYGINSKILAYNPFSDSWDVLGESEKTARAGAGMVACGSYAFVINGEIQPGIRSSEITRFSF